MLVNSNKNRIKNRERIKQSGKVFYPNFPIKKVTIKISFGRLIDVLIKKMERRKQ